MGHMRISSTAETNLSSTCLISGLLNFEHPSVLLLRSFGGIKESPCLSVRPSVQSKLNLDHNLLTKGDRALILHKCIPCDKTFLSIPKFLTSQP